MIILFSFIHVLTKIRTGDCAYTAKLKATLLPEWQWIIVNYELRMGKGSCNYGYTDEWVQCPTGSALYNELIKCTCLETWWTSWGHGLRGINQTDSMLTCYKKNWNTPELLVKRSLIHVRPHKPRNTFMEKYLQWMVNKQICNYNTVSKA